MNQLEKAVADLRHAYHQLTEGVVKDQAKFADGLIAPAIYRIEQALEAQHHHPVSHELEREIEQALTPGEPVAWMHTGGHVQVRNLQWPPETVALYTAEKGWTPLYTAPQPQREWVGLTDEELHEHCLYDEDYRFARAIEAKLREKNSSA